MEMKDVLNMLSADLVLGLVLSFIIGSIIGGPIISTLYKLKFGQNIREDGPQTHLKKAGTPTIGGLIFIFSTILAMIVMTKDIKDESVVALGAFVAFGFIGFLDDILKIIRKKNLGLRAYQKMILLLAVSLGLSYYGYTKVGTQISIPFMNAQIDLGILYIPFIIFYFASETNAVNLTDGLDGLATSVTVLVMTFLAILAFNLGHYSLSIFCVILAGALLAFLRFNAFPARVFMGDTGSLALGGAVATVGLLLKAEFLIVIVGGIYVIEALSVVIQVTSFKLTGKRVFKMAPIHHHFEQLGWKETKIVTVFAIITMILCFIGFISL